MRAGKRKRQGRGKTRLKICGITSWRDARLAVDAGADMLGFNFYRLSPRYVTPAAAKRIVSRLPINVQAVGIFVDESAEKVAAMARKVGLDAVQLHGDESPEQVAQLARQFPVIKAFRVGAKFRMATLRQFGRAHAILLDGFSRKARGGTGKTFDWGVARRARRTGRILLAGGLTPENVTQAIATVRPYAIDVCSGVEASPGKKDEAKLLKFALLFHSANHK